MQVSDNALREGVLYDILGRGSEHDPRDGSISALAERYDVDRKQAARVEKTALALFDQMATPWQLDADDRRLLGWAARIHEIGLAVAHSQYHQHGAYLIEHSDIAGFSRTEQQFIAALVRNQRRGLDMASIESLTGRLATAAMHCAQLLRLSVLLHRSHDRDDIPADSTADQRRPAETHPSEGMAGRASADPGGPGHRRRIPQGNRSQPRDRDELAAARPDVHHERNFPVTTAAHGRIKLRA